MLLLLSCSATPGLASLRHDQAPTAHLSDLASRSGADGSATGGMTPEAESAKSPTKPLRSALAMRPGAFAADAATARTNVSGTALFGNTLPRSDRAVSPGFVRTEGESTGAPAARARYRPPLAGQLSVLHRFEQPATPYAAGHRGVDLAATSGQLPNQSPIGRAPWSPCEPPRPFSLRLD